MVNLQLGFDSPDGSHSPSLVSNAFGERLYFAGRNGGPDAFEQPFNALNLVYGWYPTDHLKLQLKIKSLLDGNLEVERGGVVTLEQSIGRSGSVQLSWEMESPDRDRPACRLVRSTRVPSTACSCDLLGCDLKLGLLRFASLSRHVSRHPQAASEAPAVACNGSICSRVRKREWPLFWCCCCC